MKDIVVFTGKSSVHDEHGNLTGTVFTEQALVSISALEHDWRAGAYARAKLVIRMRNRGGDIPIITEERIDRTDPRHPKYDTRT